MCEVLFNADGFPKSRNEYITYTATRGNAETLCHETNLCFRELRGKRPSAVFDPCLNLPTSPL